MTAKTFGGVLEKSMDVLNFIDVFTNKHGYVPSRRDIVAGVDGLSSTSTVQYHIVLLQRQGLLTVEAGQARSMRITQEGQNLLRLWEW